jgi:hypothetical protein
MRLIVNHGLLVIDREHYLLSNSEAIRLVWETLDQWGRCL